MLKGWVFPNKQEVFGQLVCPTLNEMNLVRKSFFARNVLLTQTSEHLDLMWQDVFFSGSNMFAKTEKLVPPPIVSMVTFRKWGDTSYKLYN